MSREGGDNHFVSARERDLKPLREAGRSGFELSPEKGGMLEEFLESAWLAGTRGGHAKLLNQAIRQREQAGGEDWDAPLEPIQIKDLEAEFKRMMESSAEALDLSESETVALWDLLSRAWTAGVHTYESEVMASLIERRADITGEAQSWLDGDPGEEQG